MSIINYALNGNFAKFSKKLDEISKKTNKSKTALLAHFIKTRPENVYESII